MKSFDVNSFFLHVLIISNYEKKITYKDTIYINFLIDYIPFKILYFLNILNILSPLSIKYIFIHYATRLCSTDCKYAINEFISR